MNDKVKKAANVARTHPTRITGLVLVIFGALQAAAPQFQVLLSPQEFAAFNIVVGVAVAGLGFLNAGRARNGVAGDPPA